MSRQFQLELLRLQTELLTRLRGVRDARKALVYGLRATREAFGVEEAAVATLKPGQPNADLIFAMPQDGGWDLELLTQYLAGARPQIPPTTLLAPIERRGRKWAVLALRDERDQFADEHRKALFWVTHILSDMIDTLDRNRTNEVRRKIEQKIANRGEPKDLIYNILHGLRSLTHYDHSASLFITKDGSGPLELVAEQIAWTKAKSKRIGLHLELDESLVNQLKGCGVCIYNRVGDEWRQLHGEPASSLPRLLSYSSSSGQDVPPEVAMVCAPVATPDGTIGVLKISARRAGVLDRHEADLVEEFMPLASLVIQFSVRTELLREQMLRSERKHVLANLARGIAHDVNNALGAMLPLIQQLRDDASHDRLRAPAVSEDLQHIEKAIQTCRRIFGGMLAIVRGSGRAVGHGNFRRAVDGALSVLQDSMKRSAIEIVLDLPDALPTIRGAQGDLTQIVLNVLSNARDAMPNGGRLKIAARANGELLQVEVHDTGHGIPAKLLDRIWEPFFTTKDEGNGLGLAITRSIVWDIGGEMRIESEEGKGTSVFLSLPILEENLM
jgi:signal transduction histidine kinase